MHIHAPHNISVASKATVPTGEASPARFSALATRRTRAAGSPLTAREARHVGLCRFLLQVVYIFAIFPAGHTLVMMPPRIFLAHPIRIANENRLDVFLLTEGDNLPSGLVAKVAHMAFDLSPDSLQGI